MQICGFCRTQNMEGIFYCEECGTPLFGKARPNQTVDISSTQTLEDVPEVLKKSSVVGTTVLKSNTRVVLRIREYNHDIALDENETIMGRADVNATKQPDVDLTNFGAVDKGISRCHAAFQRKDTILALIDLNSTNGTFVNGNRLTPNQAHIIRDGDEVRFGKLVTHIYFK
jgi:pSer/pThr/pTyr-binding forkhead associated (FHA) protein